MAAVGYSYRLDVNTLLSHIQSNTIPQNQRIHMTHHGAVGGDEVDVKIGVVVGEHGFVLRREEAEKFRLGVVDWVVNLSHMCIVG